MRRIILTVAVILAAASAATRPHAAQPPQSGARSEK